MLNGSQFLQQVQDDQTAQPLQQPVQQQPQQQQPQPQQQQQQQQQQRQGVLAALSPRRLSQLLFGRVQQAPLPPVLQQLNQDAQQQPNAINTGLQPGVAMQQAATDASLVHQQLLSQLLSLLHQRGQSQQQLQPPAGLPSGPLTFDDLHWTQSTRKGSEHVLLAKIPRDRLGDWLEGEKQRGSCDFILVDTSSVPTRPANIRVDSIKEKKTFLCSNTKAKKPAKTEQPTGQRQGRAQAGLGQKVGCLYRFDTRVFWADEDYVTISMHQPCHISDPEAQTPCHGPSSDASNPRLLHSPHLSDEIKDYVIGILQQNNNTPARTIVLQVQQLHVDAVKRQLPHLSDEDARTMLAEDRGRHAPRDFFITNQDVFNLRAKRERMSFRRDDNDALSVRMLYNEHRDKFFVYHEQQSGPGQNRPVETSPLLLGIMTGWQRQQAWELGHGNAVLFDTTFGTNKYGFGLSTLLVVDEWKAGVPVAFVMHSRDTEAVFTDALREFKDKVREQHPTWQPKCFIVDDCTAAINAISVVFPDARVLLCTWHVERSWLKHLLSKVSDRQDRLQLFLELSAIMMGSDLDTSVASDPAAVAAETVADILLQLVKQQLQQFVAKWEVQQPAFINYFKNQWLSRAELWVVALRVFPHADQEGTQALEGAHSGIKGGAIRATKRISGRRMDWLLHMVLEDVLPYYQHLVAVRAGGFGSRQHLLQPVAAAFSKARLVPDCRVICLADGTRVSVLSMHRPGLLHEVLQPATPWSTCSCEAGMRGQLCWHQARAAMAVKGDTPDTERLFASGQVGVAVRRPGLFEGQEGATSAGAAPPQWDPQQLSRDLQALMRGELPPSSAPVRQAAADPAIAASAASGAQHTAATAASAAAAGGQTGAGVAEAAASSSAAAADQQLQQFVPNADAVISDVRLRPFCEQGLQKGRRAAPVAPSRLISTRQPRDKPPQDPLAKLQADADKAAAEAAVAAAAAQAAAAAAAAKAAAKASTAAAAQARQQQALQMQALQMQALQQQALQQQALQQALQHHALQQALQHHALQQAALQHHALQQAALQQVVQQQVRPPVGHAAPVQQQAFQRQALQQLAQQQLQVQPPNLTQQQQDQPPTAS